MLIGLLTAGVVIADNHIGESASGYLTSMPPDAPLLHSPADEATQPPDASTLIWRSQIHATSYTLQVSTSPDFSTLVVDQTSLADTLFSATTLENNTTYYWRVCACNVAGQGVYSDVWSFTTSSSSAIERRIGSIPERYALLPAYPNPFNPMTTITVHLPENAEVSIVVYNSTGQSVRELVSGLRQAGEYRVIWDGRDHHGAPIPSGLYICRFKTGGRVFTQKILLMH